MEELDSITQVGKECAAPLLRADPREVEEIRCENVNALQLHVKYSNTQASTKSGPCWLGDIEHRKNDCVIYLYSY